MKAQTEEYRRNAEEADAMARKWPEGSDLQRAYRDIANQWRNVAEVAEKYSR